MDIGSDASWPASALSNFAPHEFFIDGIRCASMEGFLQSLKFKPVDMQEFVCTLVGKGAKFKGKKKKWYKTQTLWWRGVEIPRESQEYQELISRAFDQLAQNEAFKRAITAKPDATLTHAMGKKKKSETVLTEAEFCGQLHRIRKNILRRT